MSIAEKIKSFASPAADPEILKALDVKRNADALAGKISQSLDGLRSERSEEHRNLAKAALAAEKSGDETARLKVEKRIGELDARIKTKELALSAAQDESLEAAKALHKAKVADRVRDVKRLGNQRAKAISEMQDAFATYAKAYGKVEEVNERLVAMFNGTLVPVPDDAALFRRELNGLIGRELLRAKPPSDYTGQNMLPGAAFDALAGDPALFAPLVTEIEQRNNYLLRSIEAGPKTAPQIIAATQTVAPVTVDDILSDGEPLPTGPKIDARTVPVRKVALT
jgi:hypothetical protein